MKTKYVVLYWIDEHGTPQFPGCSEAEATFESVESAELAIKELETDPMWVGTRWRITAYTCDTDQ